MNPYHKLHQKYTAQRNERKMQSIALWLQSRVYSVVNFPHMYLRKSERHLSARKKPHNPLLTNKAVNYCWIMKQTGVNFWVFNHTQDDHWVCKFGQNWTASQDNANPCVRTFLWKKLEANWPISTSRPHSEAMFEFVNIGYTSTKCFRFNDWNQSLSAEYREVLLVHLHGMYF